LFRHNGDKTFLIVIEVKNEDFLMDEVSRLENKGIKCAVFYEPDFGIGYTAFCTEALDEDKKDIFKKYNLLVI